MKNVLVLGAGLVSRPLVRHLLDESGARVVVAAMNVERAHELVADHPRGLATWVDADDVSSLDALVREAEVVVSLLPQTHHARVARLAIRHHVPLVTTSYVSEEMQGLDGEARRAGVLLLNEVGLDPGIDHMSAMRILDRIRGEGGSVLEFSSCCGGLPAADANDNPWGYKFSWSPRGVLLAGRNPARYLRGGDVVEIPGPLLFSSCWPIEIDGLGRFEVYPNRDALAYVPLYGLAGIGSMFRGTIRHPGWCATLSAIVALGLLDGDERPFAPGTTYASLAARALPAGRGPLRKRIAARLGLDERDPVLARLEWAGLLAEDPLPTTHASPLDLLSARLQERLSYAPGERDMVVLRHEILARRPDGARERTLSQLVVLGDEGGDSAMARTVSLPAAVAARLVLEGRIGTRGVAIPVLPEIYGPVLEEIEQLGIAFEERVEAGGKSA